jgi:hypothetical protein
VVNEKITVALSRPLERYFSDERKMWKRIEAPVDDSTYFIAVVFATQTVLHET